MAHFAQLNESNEVTQVIVVSNDCCLDENGQESEEVGIAFCKSILGASNRWVQTSYNGNFRGTYAGVGFFYDEQKDRFVPPRPYETWVFNEDSYKWEPPTPQPTNIPEGYIIGLAPNGQWEVIPIPTEQTPQ